MLDKVWAHPHPRKYKIKHLFSTMNCKFRLNGKTMKFSQKLLNSKHFHICLGCVALCTSEEMYMNVFRSLNVKFVDENYLSCLK